MKSPVTHSFFCKNHSDTKEIGKCKVCGKSGCSSCTIICKNQLYCRSTGTPQSLIPTNNSTIIASSISANNIRLWGVVTFILCSIAAGSIAVREIYQLQKENKALRESRIHLISIIKKNNQELRTFRGSRIQTVSTQFKQGRDIVTHTTQGVNTSPLHTTSPDYSSSFSFSNGSFDKRLISLTFDGGSDANTAVAILDTLRSRNVKATIFVTGQFIKKFPDIITLFLGEGHEIGNHTLTHPHLTSFPTDKTQTTLPEITSDFLCKELKKNDELFYSITGQHFAPLWRSPFGEFNKIICAWAKECGYMHVGWRQGQTWREGLDSNDWIPNEETPGFKKPTEVLNKILDIARSNSNTLNGGIILMHLGTTRTDPEMQVYTVLGTLIDSLHQRGYRIIPVSEMIQESGFYLASLPSNIHFQDSITR